MRDVHQPWESNPRKRPLERWLGFLPLYHAYGQLYTILMAAKLQIPIYVMKTFAYENFLRVIQDHKITHLQAAPPILVMLSKRPETAKYDLSSVVNILCGAAPLSKQLQNDVASRFNVRISQGWGMTEVTCGAIHMPLATEDFSGSVGLLDPNSECMLLDDDGHEVPLGSRGELFVRGPQVCLRYWKNVEASKESISPDGWLRTGDIAICDERGWFWIIDRKKVSIWRGEHLVDPALFPSML